MNPFRITAAILLLSSPLLHAQFSVVEQLVPEAGPFEYLYYTDLAGTPTDPATIDVDFNTTWFDSNAYDGPAFGGPAPAPIGYGAINVSPVQTDVGGPPGIFDTLYLRTTFTPTMNLDGLRFTGAVDDGCILYINGSEVARINMGRQSRYMGPPLCRRWKRSNSTDRSSHRSFSSRWRSG